MSATYPTWPTRQHLLRTVYKAESDERIFELLLSDLAGLFAVQRVEGLANLLSIPGVLRTRHVLGVEGDEPPRAVMFQPLPPFGLLKRGHCLFILFFALLAGLERLVDWRYFKL